MKLLRVLLSLAILAQVTFLVPPALAGTASIKSDSISELDANVQSLGNMQFGKARAVISDNRIDILFTVVDLKTGRLQEEKSLTGLVLFSGTYGQGGSRILTGGAYFDGGRELSKLLSDATEYVKTTSGQKVTGRISQVSRIQLSVETTSGSEEFLISDLAEIHSPRFFQFSIPIAEATGSDATFTGQSEEITFNTATEIPNAKPATKPSPEPAEPTISSDKPAIASDPQKTNKPHMSKKAKVVSLVVLGCVIATAIAVPIAVACGTSGGGNNNQQRTMQTFALQQFLTAGR